MNYAGKLYGKIGKRYIPLLMTSEEVDDLVLMKEALAEVLQEIDKGNSLTETCDVVLKAKALMKGGDQ